MGNHRADRRGRSAVTGLRRPARLAQAVLAVAAMGLVAAGFLGIHAEQRPFHHSPLTLSAGRTALDRTDALVPQHDARSRARSRVRSRALSRDSERQALRDAAGQRLQAAAERQSRQRDAALTRLAKSAERHANEIKANQWVLPTKDFHLTAGFGMAGGLWVSNHTGLDFAAPYGTPIFAVADGVVTATGYDGSYGNRTVETLPDGTEIWYAHQRDIDVRQGQQVTQGQVIGHIGTTGNTTGPHVHIEVRPGGGDPVDPYPAFVHHGVKP
ncbi:MAG: M23 family metallopeptidase [Marmoricola sp.]